jgi:hypothetical protein
MIGRRALVAGAVSLLAAPLAVGAQPAGKVPRIGILRQGSLRSGVGVLEPYL